jgi:hypothetical protein
LEKAREHFLYLYRKARGHKFDNTEVKRTVITLYDDVSQLANLCQALEDAAWKRRAASILTDMNLPLIGRNVYAEVNALIDRAHRNREVRPSNRITGRYLQKLQGDLAELLQAASAIAEGLTEQSIALSGPSKRALASLAERLCKDQGALANLADQASSNSIVRPLLQELIHQVEVLIGDHSV